MTNQLLFDDLFREPLASPPPARALARKTDSAGSHRAAKEMEASGALTDHASRIMAVLNQGGGWTAYEIAEACGLNNVQVSRRLSAMPGVRKMGEAGARKCKVTGGSCATYWAQSWLEKD